MEILIQLQMGEIMTKGRSISWVADCRRFFQIWRVLLCGMNRVIVDSWRVIGPVWDDRNRFEVYSSVNIYSTSSRMCSFSIVLFMEESSSIGCYSCRQLSYVKYYIISCGLRDGLIIYRGVLILCSFPLLHLSRALVSWRMALSVSPDSY